MRDLLRVLLRIAAVTLFEAAAVFVAAWLLPGIILIGTTSQQLLTAIAVAVVLGLLNGLIRPLIVLAGLSINLYTVGLFTLFVNSGILLLSAYFLPGFDVDGFLSAVLGSVALAAANTFITGLISIDQDYAYFDGVVSWLSRRNLEPGDQTQSRGLVILEIDGLSY
ncbi:MAG: phage holin family protein, partial [Candidatus Promineifilaceae bacterium]